MSRRRRVLLWFDLLVVLAGVGLVAVRSLTGRAHNITAASVARLNAGMTAQEIDALLGLPPGPRMIAEGGSP